jgi:hypothetical protein
MKRFFLLSLIVFLAILFPVLGFLAPFHFYSKTLSTGVKSDFLELPASSLPMLNAGAYEAVKMAGLYGEEHAFWREFHFADFVIPLPVRHPLYVFIPLIELEEDEAVLHLGANLENRQGRLMAGFKTGKRYRFEIDFSGNLLFQMPIFKNWILKRGEDQVWRDLFSKDIRAPHFEWSRPWKALIEYLEIGHRELVYNLFLLRMRHKYLPSHLTNLGLYGERSYGVVETKRMDEGELGEFRIETVHILERGIVHTFEIHSRIAEITAEAFRKRFLEVLRYRASAEEDSVAVYAQYKTLPYQSKIDQEGLVYIFTAWTHVPERREFLQEMISFLERGKGNEKNLAPLYDYAYEKYGTSFSIREDTLRESAPERLKRKLREEVEEEVRKAREAQTTTTDGDFQSEDAKVEYYLQKAKDEGSIKEDKSLYLDN